MKKFITANLVAITSLIGTIIIGLSSIAWSNEKSNIYKDIKAHRVSTHLQDSLLWNEFQEHDDKHKEEKADRILNDEKFYKYLDHRFDGLEKLMNAKTRN